MVTLADMIASKATIQIDVLPEDILIEDSFTEQESINFVRQLASETEWGWCCVKVTVHYGDLTETEYLEACSYRNESEFRECPYYADMVSECCARLADSVASIVREHRTHVL